MKNQSFRKTIDKNKLTVKNQNIQYISHDGFTILVEAVNDSSYESVLEFIYNAANNNIVGNELVVKFRKALVEKELMKPVYNLY